VRIVLYVHSYIGSVQTVIHTDIDSQLLMAVTWP